MGVSGQPVHGNKNMLCIPFRPYRAENINDLISRYILPIRPDKTYARQPRFQVPASFAYRFV